VLGPNFHQGAVAAAGSEGIILWLRAFRRASAIVFCRFLLGAAFLRKANTRRLLGLTWDTLKLLGIWRVFLNVFGPLDVLNVVSCAFAATGGLLLP